MIIILSRSRQLAHRLWLWCGITPPWLNQKILKDHSLDPPTSIVAHYLICIMCSTQWQWINAGQIPVTSKCWTASASHQWTWLTWRIFSPTSLFLRLRAFDQLYRGTSQHHYNWLTLLVPPLWSTMVQVLAWLSPVWLYTWLLLNYEQSVLKEGVNKQHHGLMLVK